MAVKPDDSPPGDVAAQRRWMITLAITLVFGGFGAVMAYLNYSNHKQGRAESSNTAPTTTPAVAPPVAEPGDDRGNKDKGKPGKDM